MASDAVPGCESYLDVCAVGSLCQALIEGESGRKAKALTALTLLSEGCPVAGVPKHIS